MSIKIRCSRVVHSAKTLVGVGLLCLLPQVGRAETMIYPVEYIESDGAQYIKTDFDAVINSTSARNDVLEATFSIPNPSISGALFGGSWSNNQYLLITRGSSFLWYGAGATVCGASANTRYKVRIGDGKVTITNLDMDSTASINSTVNEKASPFFVFAANGGSCRLPYKLYSLKIWTNDMLAHDLQPTLKVEDGVSVVGLRDRVTESFYANVNTSAAADFGYGKIIGNCVTIQSSGLELQTPANSGIDSNGYGFFLTKAGETVSSTIADPVCSTETVQAVLAGWSLTIRADDGTVTTTTSTPENYTTCSYTPAEGDEATLTWLWDVKKLFVTVEADEGLAVTPSSGWYDYGAELSFSVASADSAAVFMRWTGDIATASPAFTHTLTQPLTVRANKASELIYVAPDGAGDGTSWESPYGSIQDALDNSKVEGGSAAILLRAGDYPVTTAIVNKYTAPVYIGGGFAGDGLTKDGETVIGRFDDTIATKAFIFSNASVVLDTLTISNTFLNASGTYGNGISFLNSSTGAVINCRFVKNGNGAFSSDYYLYGAGIGINGGALTVDGCIFEDNALSDRGNNNQKGYGAGICANNAAVIVRNSRFDRNYTQTVHGRVGGGGAIALMSVPMAEISDCLFTTNYVRRSTGSDNYTSADQTGNGPWGGTIFVRSSNDVSIHDCTVLGGWNNCALVSSLYLGWGHGGVFYFESSKVALSRTVVYGAGYTGYTSGATFYYGSGSIDVVGGSLFMTNVLHGAAYAGWALGCRGGGHVEAVNCTFAGNRGGDKWFDAVAYMQRDVASTATFDSCILWDNDDGDMTIIDGADPVFTYSTTQAEHAGALNATNDPYFADSVYFHPLSAAGHYADGWLGGGAWTVSDGATSGTIDAGNPALALGAEPQPNGWRINRGYDAGTSVASMSALDSEPVVDDGTLKVVAYPPRSYVAGGAVVAADIASAGAAESATVTLVWSTSGDQGTASVGAWDNSYVFPDAAVPWETLTHTITGIAPGETATYRFFADNGSATDWSDPAQSFICAEVPQLAYAEKKTGFVYRESASVYVDVVCSGDDTLVSVVATPVGDDAAAATRHYANFGLPVSSGRLDVSLTGLAPGTTYSVYAMAENSSGSVLLDAFELTTVGAEEPLILYAAPQNASDCNDGSSPECASADYNMLFRTVSAAIDEVRFLAGVYTNASEIFINDIAMLNVRGGYTGNGEERTGETVFCCDTTSDATRCRIVRVKDSTVTFDRITVRDGFANGLSGSGLYGVNSHIVVTNCVFAENGLPSISANTTTLGGAIYTLNGSLAVYDSTFVSNCVQNAYYPNGGAIACENTKPVVLKNNRFDRNYVYGWWDYLGRGGALYFSGCTPIEIDNCLFASNYASRAYTGDYTSANGNKLGGAIYFTGCTKIALGNSEFIGNWSGASYGGAIYSYNSTLAIDKTIFTLGGDSGYDDETKLQQWTNGGIAVEGGNLYMTNVLHSASRMGWCLRSNNSVVKAHNCTFAGARGNGLGLYGVAFWQVNATTAATFHNCIFTDLEDGVYRNDSGLSAVFTSSVGEGLGEGDGNILEKPLFGDAVYCHPQSRAGRYDGDWFGTNGTWVADEATCPSIDAGDAALDVGDEPQPNRHRINCGYDAGTAVASKSDLGTDPIVGEGELKIFAYDPSDYSVDGILVSAEVGAMDSAAASVVLVWDYTDYGDDVAQWSHQASLGNYPPWTLVSYRIPEVEDPDKTVYYRFFATRDELTAYSDPVRSFRIGKKPAISYDGDQPVSHLYRTSATIHAIATTDSDTTSYFIVNYYRNDEPSVCGALTNVVNRIVDGEPMTFTLTGLEPGITYCCSLEAVSVAGKTTSFEEQFTTVGADETLVLYMGVEARGRGDGLGYGNAATDLGALIGGTAGGKGEIRIDAGAFTNDEVIAVCNHPGLTLRGGYTGETTREGRSVIARDPAGVRHRVFEFGNCTLHLDALSIENGLANTTNAQRCAQGVLLNSCSTIISDCVFAHNGTLGYAQDGVTGAGGAVGAHGGTLEITGCTFEDNAISTDNKNHTVVGGAAGAVGASQVTVRDSRFLRNFCQTIHARDNGGGALGFSSCTTVIVERCYFETNYVRTANNASIYNLTGQYTYQGPYGGTIYMKSVTRGEIADCEIRGGWSNTYSSTPTPRWGFGGTMYFVNSEVSLVRTSVYDVGYTGYVDTSDTAKVATGSIDNRGGSLYMTNVLFAASYSGHALGCMESGTIEAVNCTLADTKSFGGSMPSVAVLSTGGSVKLLNCIAWGQAGALSEIVESATLAVSYCDTEEAVEGEGNISDDPLFLLPAEGNYHLHKTSPCRDKGLKDDRMRQSTDLDGNKRLRGASVDMGCYELQSLSFSITVR